VTSAVIVASAAARYFARAALSVAALASLSKPLEATERAVRAALAIQRALAELNRKNADTGKPVISRPKSDGVTGYVTSSHGAATPLRYDVTGYPRLPPLDCPARDLRERPLDPQALALGSPFWSVSRQTIYRVKSPVHQVHRAEIQPGVGGDAGNNRLAH
jgi:hypothetical protein